MNKVSCNLGWRLGNILFQIFTTLSHAKKCNKEPLFWVNRDTTNLLDYEYIFKNINFVENKLNFENSYQELGNFEYLDIPCLEGDLLLNGYFQSQKYFENIEVHDFLNQEYILSIQKKYGHILDKNTISIHIRRGDYVHQQNFHPVLDIGYYHSAIEKIKELTGRDFLVVIFSDDLEWISNNFSGENFFIVDDTDYNSLFLMSLCDHNITANSTFSWWGAYLNRNKNKIIISPKTWFGPGYAHFNTSDLYIRGSIKI
jgi:hypothetical protein